MLKGYPQLRPRPINLIQKLLEKLKFNSSYVHDLLFWKKQPRQRGAFFTLIINETKRIYFSLSPALRNNNLFSF